MGQTKRFFLSGNEAAALGAWQAGCQIAAAYPGTPSSEVVPAFVAWAKRLGGQVYAEWSVNEKVAVEVASGAAMAGARAMAVMKHVGLNVAADPLFTLAYTGAEAGLVVVVADDPQMHSSQNEQDSRIYARHAGVPVLDPADSQEACDFTRLAFGLSEQVDLPVLVRLTTRVSHSRALVSTDASRQEKKATGAPINPRKYTMIPAHARERHVSQQQRLARVRRWAESAEVNRSERGSGDVGFIAVGVAYQYLRELLPDATVFKLGMSWPLPAEALRRFCSGLERVIVVEELEPFVYEQVSAIGIQAEPLPEAYRLGELTAGRLAEALGQMGVNVPAERVPRLRPMPADAPAEEDIPARPPALCPGCPHRTVFYALRELKVYVTGDIGCYTLGTLEPLSALHTCLCMGAGINQAHGIIKATGRRQKVVAVIGDSTFTHMGMPGLLNAVYNSGDIVVVVLDNRTTAMTGGQDHPGTGRTLMGEPAPALDFARLAEALGAGFVKTVPAADLNGVETALREAIEFEGPAVVIIEGPCALQYGLRKPPFAVDAATCIACGACLRLGCPAISAQERDRKRWPQIDALLCVGCGLCAQVCPTGAIVREPGHG